MAKKRIPSLDSAIKSLFNQFATNEDISQVIKRIGELEKAILKPTATPSPSKTSRVNGSASDKVLNFISEIQTGAKFSEIQESTGLDDKKLRNIIYRLSKQGKIQTAKRGIYIPV